eukprot:CAMPEP_0194218958 /NCGR_PEP_ID=MMETSP0156-20130528/24897_1 /TAXON_ID=33649 /ORGANISM="Thalassionema nitzschioides, Strain L26-B" /LENGTH=640 /DNA_ID=CAMNT_0038948473 /DNA_START=269 /DNA_END=2189 /DNA_ORIENTATION=-
MSTTSTATAQTATKSEQLRVLSSSHNAHDPNEPLPPDLKKILTEVAQYGGSSWLSWSTEQQQQPLHNMMNNNSPYRFHIKRSPPKRRRNKQRTNNAASINTSNTSSAASTTNAAATTTTTANSTANKRPLPTTVIPLLSGASDSNCSYECDSEGTSSVSEMSSNAGANDAHRRTCLRYNTLAKAVSAGIAFVLDHSYRTQGGYKPTSAEICQFQNSQMKQQQNNNNNNPQTAATSSPESVIFQQRKQRLVQSVLLRNDGPPFTIQRLTEVMVDPARFYKQTHKLCNCFEKLLLVASSIHAFGGSTGGTTSQSRQEERELAALSDERERQEKTEQENRRQRRRVQSESSISESHHHHHHASLLKHQNEIAAAHHHHHHHHAAKLGLRHKFEPSSDTITTNNDTTNHNSPTNSPTTSPTTKKRSLTSSPPPPPSFHGQQNDHHRAPSPILFATDGARLSPERNSHLLQMHHHDRHTNNTALGEGLPLDVVRIHNNNNNNASLGGGSNHTTASSNHKETSPNSGTSKDTSDADTEIDPGRSSASNSDVDDSESDVSLDDNSDGSDCFDGQQEQPFSAARLMALNRKQQQQRLQQSRVQMLVGEQYAHQQLIATTEYQSGDSIDSTMAEDSGGSDSSSSDLADE